MFVMPVRLTDSETKIRIKMLQRTKRGQFKDQTNSVPEKTAESWLLTMRINAISKEELSRRVNLSSVVIRKLFNRHEATPNVFNKVKAEIANIKESHKSKKVPA